jgi:hypothetical protein
MELCRLEHGFRLKDLGESRVEGVDEEEEA